MRCWWCRDIGVGEKYVIVWCLWCAFTASDVGSFGGATIARNVGRLLKEVGGECKIFAPTTTASTSTVHTATCITASTVVVVVVVDVVVVVVVVTVVVVVVVVVVTLCIVSVYFTVGFGVSLAAGIFVYDSIDIVIVGVVVVCVVANVVVNPGFPVLLHMIGGGGHLIINFVTRW